MIAGHLPLFWRRNGPSFPPWATYIEQLWSAFNMDLLMDCAPSSCTCASAMFLPGKSKTVFFTLRLPFVFPDIETAKAWEAFRK
jgi:hypothetical protein